MSEAGGGCREASFETEEAVTGNSASRVTTLLVGESVAEPAAGELGEA